MACKTRSLSESDCSSLKRKLEQAWSHDAVAAQRMADTDVFNQFIRDEGQRLSQSFLGRCREMVGRPVSEEEIACFEDADTIDDIYACAP